MEDNYNIDDLFSCLLGILKNGNFPDDSFEEKHFIKTYFHERITDKKVQFSVERHPHIFGHPSKGIASSAFATVNRNFELDIETKNVVFIDEQVLSVTVDYENGGEIMSH